MLNISAPQHDFAALYRQCSQRTNNFELSARLLAEEPRVLARAQEYRRVGRDISFYSIIPEQPIFVSAEALAHLYSRVLVKGGERSTYNALRSGSPLSRCPFCAQRDVLTLDHYLSRSEYPEFAVLPLNLVPSCWDCNHTKHGYRAESLGEMLFHPYFDNWSEHTLFVASVSCDQYVSVDYYVNPNLPQDLLARVQNHFRKLELAKLYSEHASIELIQKKITFEAAFQAGGCESLREELLLEARSRLAPFPNAWQPVLYDALANCDEFCQGGYTLI